MTRPSVIIHLMTQRVPTQRVASAVSEVCDSAANGDELLEDLSTLVQKIVPFDGATWFGTDPATLLATNPTRIEGIEAGHCDTFWLREFHVDDANLYRDMYRSGTNAAALRLTTDDQPVRSARYREFLTPQNYGDELRALFRIGDNTWGLLGLYRDAGLPAFTAADVAFIDSITTTVAAALRIQTAGNTPWVTSPSAPGLMMFDRQHRLVSSNPEAPAWLSEIAPGSGFVSADPLTPGWVTPDAIADHHASGIPASVNALIARAYAVASGHEKGPARLRLRGRNGQWLVLHASPMSFGDDRDLVAVVIEPAKSSEIAPIIVEAYALSPRERDVVRYVAQGLSGPEIAAELFLSPHTIRDYIKSVFEKVGVSSRGELVAKLFAEHYREPLHAGAVHTS